MVSQNSTPVVDFKVIYKPNTQQGSSNSNGIMCIPSLTLTLADVSGYSKIYFKLIDQHSNAVVYQANYSLSSNEVKNNLNITLFNRNSQTVNLSSGELILLKPYRYEIYFEDAQLNKSNVYTRIN